MSSIYIDLGDGYKESNRVFSTGIFSESIRFKFDLRSYKGQIKNLRWDPVENQFFRCKIEYIKIDNVVITSYHSNAWITIDNFDYLLTTDPMYYIEHDFTESEYLEIICNLIPLTPQEIFQYMDNEIQIKNRLRTEINELNDTNKKIKEKNRELIESADIMRKENAKLVEENDMSTKALKIAKEENDVSVKVLEIVREENIKLTENIEFITKEIHNIQNSYSWKMTRPLREIKSIILGLMKRM